MSSSLLDNNDNASSSKKCALIVLEKMDLGPIDFSATLAQTAGAIEQIYWLGVYEVNNIKLSNS